jgi:hypothetical protein
MRKFPWLTFFILLPVPASELAAHLWMNPPPSEKPQPVLFLDLSPPSVGWEHQPDAYRQVEPILRCTDGWIANLVEQDAARLRISYFEWDESHTVNTLEAFKHLPEQCMGSIGMKLEQEYPDRVFQSDSATLVFSSNLFRPLGGGEAVHVFKCVWVSGFDSTSLRDGVIMGNSGVELRRLRLAAAATRFKPPHTRIVMGTVSGMPSEDLAWHLFSRKILQPHLRWKTHKNPTIPPRESAKSPLPPPFQPPNALPLSPRPYLIDCRTGRLPSHYHSPVEVREISHCSSEGRSRRPS